MPTGRITPFRALLSILAAGAAVVTVVPESLAAQDVCPRASGVHAEAGWVAYADGDMTEARSRFVAAVGVDPLGVGYDRGILPEGPPPDGFWQRSTDGTVLEVRIPWLLLNVTDPSSRTVLQGPGEANTRAHPPGLPGHAGALRDHGSLRHRCDGGGPPVRGPSRDP